jgi:hypothetical protein
MHVVLALMRSEFESAIIEVHLSDASIARVGIGGVPQVL